MQNIPSPPAAERARQGHSALAGELRLLATLEAMILALLAAFFGRRRTAAHWHALSPLDYVNDDEDLPYAALYASIAAHPPVLRRHYALPIHTHQGIEHPLLYVLGPGPNRGMRPHPRTLPHAHPTTARAPPPSPAHAFSPLPQGSQAHTLIVLFSK
jgi:hypothetical protein